jgi:hypothetical protein
MIKVPKARAIAPILHASLFGIASPLLLFSHDAIFDGPASVLISILWVADIPISIVASYGLIFNQEYATLVWTLWGVLGTIWWYFLGLSIEAWCKRLSKRSP